MENMFQSIAVLGAFSPNSGEKNRIWPLIELKSRQIEIEKYASFRFAQTMFMRNFIKFR